MAQRPGRLCGCSQPWSEGRTVENLGLPGRLPRIHSRFLFTPPWGSERRCDYSDLRRDTRVGKTGGSPRSHGGDQVAELEETLWLAPDSGRCWGLWAQRA